MLQDMVQDKIVKVYVFRMYHTRNKGSMKRIKMTWATSIQENRGDLDKRGSDN